MEYKIGFIGVGNMGLAMIDGIIKAGYVKPEEIIIHDINYTELQKIKQSRGLKTVSTNVDVVIKSNIIILAVKPNVIPEILDEIKNYIDEKKLIITIAAGIEIQFYKKILGQKARIIRVMPNTPVIVGEGMSLITYGDEICEEYVNEAFRIFNCFGKTEFIEEKLMSAVTALTGSSPAYVFLFIEAMSDAAVHSGIPRKLSYKLAAQSVLGAAKLILETGRHPGELKDQVCSPAGTAIEAIRVFERKGFRSTVIESMIACVEKSKKIGSEINEKYSQTDGENL